MSHEIERNEKGNAEIAYANNVPWHGLGQKLDEKATLEQWRTSAGLDWEVKRAVVQYLAETNGGTTTMDHPDRHVLYRSDNHRPLGVVSEGYHLVQPADILEFYRDLMSRHGFTMEVAGALNGGKRVWALANTGSSTSVGVKADLLKRYVLLATSYDTTMATVAMHTSIRVVCNNTLTLAADNKEPKISIPHNTAFDANRVKVDLGLKEPWEDFQGWVREMAKRKCTIEEAAAFFLRTYYGDDADDDDSDVDVENPAVARRLGRMLQLWAEAPGNDLDSANGKLWGLVNAVTYNHDHEAQARSNENRLNSAWFGEGQRMKQRAWKHACNMLDAA